MGRGLLVAFFQLANRPPLPLVGRFQRPHLGAVDSLHAAHLDLFGCRSRCQIFVKEPGVGFREVSIGKRADDDALLDAMGRESSWEINKGGVALMWRGGCIIRAQFLDRIKEKATEFSMTEAESKNLDLKLVTGM